MSEATATIEACPGKRLGASPRAPERPRETASRPVTGAWNLTRRTRTPRAQPCPLCRCPGSDLSFGFGGLRTEARSSRRDVPTARNDRDSLRGPPPGDVGFTRRPRFCSGIPNKKKKPGGTRTGRRAVSGASASAWSDSTRRSQATVRSPEVRVLCEERYEGAVGRSSGTGPRSSPGSPRASPPPELARRRLSRRRYSSPSRSGSKLSGGAAWIGSARGCDVSSSCAPWLVGACNTGGPLWVRRPRYGAPTTSSSA
jgi:hypothetical protein